MHIDPKTSMLCGVFVDLKLCLSIVTNVTNISMNTELNQFNMIFYHLNERGRCCTFGIKTTIN